MVVVGLLLVVFYFDVVAFELDLVFGCVVLCVACLVGGVSAVVGCCVVGFFEGWGGG